MDSFSSAASAYSFYSVALSVALSVDVIQAVSRNVAKSYAGIFSRARLLLRWYGPSGILLLLFGRRTIWRIQAQVLGEMDDNDALNFRKSISDECTMISVAVGTADQSCLPNANKWQAAIVAQIAITGLSLDSLSQTHWTARAALVLSLTFALIAVYYATTQQRIFGRKCKAKEVRQWIRQGGGQSDAAKLMLLPYFRIFAKASGGALPVFTIRFDSKFKPMEPNDYSEAEDLPQWGDVEDRIIQHCFTPSVAPVLTISAPQILLSGSLCMLLVALGIYLGFVWTQNLDPNAGQNDSRNVFISYVVGLAVAWLVYYISQLVQDSEKRSERHIVNDYLYDYAKANPDVVNQWGYNAVFQDGQVSFIARPRTDGMNQNARIENEHQQAGERMV